jgi:hypothetical protein
VSEPVPYKDRSAGLILFGALEMLLALGCLGMLALASLGFAVAPQGGAPVPLRTMLPSLGIYLLLGAFFAAMGIGTILARRWARTLMLIVSWLWMIVGILSLGVLLFVLPDLFDRIQEIEGAGNPQAAEMMGFVRGCALAVIALMYVVLPGIFILFYRGRNVRATFEARDPVPRWTDRCPAPVLALSLILGYAAFAFLVTAAIGAVPFFGQVMTGPAAVLVLVVLAAMMVVLARAVYRLEPWSWWAVAAFWLLGSLSSASFVLGGFDWRALYAAMGMPTQEIEKLGLFEALQGPAMKVLVALSTAGTLGYLLWVRRFFHRPARPVPAPGETP